MKGQKDSGIAVFNQGQVRADPQAGRCGKKVV